MLDKYMRAPVANYENEYEVDTLGNVFSLKSKKQLMATDYGSKYLQVSLCKNGKRKVVYVHRLVAETFLPNPEGLPQINHKDEDKHNNILSNLEWCDASYNYWYGTNPARISAKKKGVSPSKETRGKQSAIMKKYWSEHKHPRRNILLICENDGNIYTSYSEAARAYGITYKNVESVCKGRKESINGYFFRIIEKAATA